jgi:hypothetical protein
MNKLLEDLGRHAWPSGQRAPKYMTWKMSSRRANGWLMTVILLLMASGPLGVARAKESQAPQADQKNNFYIISMVNPANHELLLKNPTEVAEVIQVNEKTVCLDQQGKAIQIKDLRSGDTIYATIVQKAPGVFIATRIQMGPMTVAELHRRYLTEY